MPDARTVYRWLEAHDLRRQRYSREREWQADVLAGQILEISDDGSNDYTQTEDGEALQLRDVLSAHKKQPNWSFDSTRGASLNPL
jgi:hypothetical protein